EHDELKTIQKGVPFHDGKHERTLGWSAARMRGDGAGRREKSERPRDQNEDYCEHENHSHSSDHDRVTLPSKSRFTLSITIEWVNLSCYTALRLPPSDTNKSS